MTLASARLGLGSRPRSGPLLALKKYCAVRREPLRELLRVGARPDRPGRRLDAAVRGS